MPARPAERRLRRPSRRRCVRRQLPRQASTAASTGAVASLSTSPSGAPSSRSPAAALTKLVVGLGYIPSVQFAPFYLAEQKGYYEDAGLDVEFQSKFDDNLIPLVGQGAIDVGIGDGTSVIPAVSQGIPVRYIATIYGKFPNVVFAKASSGIKTAADLKGKKIGTPGRYGSGWVMLQALLASAGLKPTDVQIVEYPDYTQRAAVEQGAVDAATGFANNEPVQLELGGEPAAVVLRIDAITPLPGPGLIAGTKTLETKHDAVAGVRRRDAAGDERDQGESRRPGSDAAITRGARARAQKDLQNGDPRRHHRLVDRADSDGPRARRDRRRRLDEVRRVPPVARSREIAGDRGWPRPERSPARGRVKARVWFPEERISDERLVVGRPERRRSHSGRRSALVHPDLVPSGTMGPESRRRSRPRESRQLN